MEVFLRNGVETEYPDKILLRYYQQMGRGVRAYDEGHIPPDTQFSREQLIAARDLANKLGGRGIPNKAIDDLCARQTTIAEKLSEVPPTIMILNGSEHIPWRAITGLFSVFRVPYVTITRYTKMLHKKRPNLIPILDSCVRDDYLSPTIAASSTAGLSDGEKATFFMREIRKDVITNREALLQLHEWQGKPYEISVVRILDILIWCRFGPFRSRFADLYT